MTPAQIRQLVKEFRFKETFNGLGWNAPRTAAFDRTVAGSSYRFMPIAEQGGVHAFEIQSQEGYKIPDTGTRKAIDSAISGQFNRNLLIFVNPSRTQAYVQGVVYRDGKRLTRGIPFQLGRPIEPIIRLFQSLDIPYDLFDPQGNVAATAAIDIAEKPFLADKVTKKFFKDFSDKRKEFVRFLSWIEDESKREWYCSILLNRLLFVYFIAERGFLPGSKQFLSNMLRDNAAKHGKDTFYTHFLLPFSIFGLGKDKGERGRFEAEFADVLYLNGGLFALHKVERDDLHISEETVQNLTYPPEAKIPDSEFKKWFDYLNAWRWTLDEEKHDNDISPNILGYIFEKYINQKQMGAYYTKEDITGYICRNTIIPRLFDMLAEESDRTGDPRYRQAVEPLPIGPHPNLLNKGLGVSQGEGIDRYVYSAVKQTEPLPTETAYEQAQREKRYEGILQDFDDGKIGQINDFINSNLDIERFAQDFVATIQDPQVLWAFWDRCLTKITILDPTCGSGAFLFAALRILFPLYATALKRMEELLKASGEESVPVVTIGGRFNMPEVETQPEFPLPSESSDLAYAHFRATLDEVTKDHPHADYFIKKKIIVQNLYGVDIMEEAVEICKLRLFLELMRTVEKEDAKPNFGVEPLPDIDFNILAGNTLVGYTSIADIDHLWEQVELGSSTLAFEKDHSRLITLKKEYAKLLEAWRLQQLGEWTGRPVTKEQVLRAVEDELRPELNKDLWRLYRTAKLLPDSVTQVSFQRSHEPFHWLIEFPAIEAQCGFDVIVGNPPYIEYSEVRQTYTLLGLECLPAGNLYAYIIEKSIRVLGPTSRIGMIIQLSAFCTPRMEPFQEVWFRKMASSQILFFDDRPGKLFDGLTHIRAAIAIGTLGSESSHLFTTKYIKFPTEFRPYLFETLSLARNTVQPQGGTVLKISTHLEDEIARKLWATSSRLRDYFTDANDDNWVYYSYGYGYWGKILSHLPFFEGESGERSTGDKFLYLKHDVDRNVVVAVMNSSLFYWYYITSSDGHNFTKTVIGGLPYATPNDQQSKRLAELSRELMRDLEIHKQRKHVLYKATGQVQYDEYYPSKSKHIIDEIDRVLAKHYGFTDEEIEFIINYDLKYRMGRDVEEEE